MHGLLHLVPLSLVAGSFVMVILAQPVARADGASPGSPKLDAGQRETLNRYAQDTWRSFEAMIMPGGLPADGLRLGVDGTWKPSEKTSPTDIGAYLWSTLAAEFLGLIDATEAGRRLDQTLGALARVERVRGLFLDRLDPRTGAPQSIANHDGKSLRPLLSAVDNGWLAAALIMVSNTRPALRERAERLLKTFGTLSGLVNTEQRIASYIGIARGQLPCEHYYRINRTWRPERGPQQQVPQGESRTYLGVEVFEGHYTYRGMRIVPSWGGSMFEALMVPLFVPEVRWAPRSWGVNHPLYVRAQIEHGLIDRQYGFWGFSPACRPEGGYRIYGVKALGTDPKGYTTHEGDVPSGSDQGSGKIAGGVVTPHASFLTLPFAPREAMANLQALIDKFPIYGPYGFRDSVNLSTGEVSDCVLALDQGMIMAVIANALAGDAMQHAFADGPVEAAIRSLISQEEFTSGPHRPTDADSDAAKNPGPRQSS
jgi:hypothetical protein